MNQQILLNTGSSTFRQGIGKAGVTLRVTRWCALEGRGCPERNFNSVSEQRSVGSGGIFQGGPWRPLTAPLEREREWSEHVWGWRWLEEERRRKPGGLGTMLVRAPPEGLGRPVGRRMTPRGVPGLPLAAAGPFVVIPSHGRPGRRHY